jgi:hypothetical protein
MARAALASALRLQHAWAAAEGPAFAAAAALPALPALGARGAAGGAPARAAAAPPRRGFASGGVNPDGTPFADAERAGTADLCDVHGAARPAVGRRRNPRRAPLAALARRSACLAPLHDPAVLRSPPPAVPEPVDQVTQRQVQIAQPGLFKDFGGRLKFSGPASSERNAAAPGCPPAATICAPHLCQGCMIAPRLSPRCSLCPLASRQVL